MTYAILGFAAIAIAGAVSGWVAAWRARGAANDAADRARIAEAKIEEISLRALAAESAATVANARRESLEAELTRIQAQIAQSRAERGELLEQIAKLGVPVGDVLYDSTIDRLYKDRDRTGGSQGSRASRDPDPVSGDPAGAATAGPKKA
jgi:anti-sigma factor RsiW